MAHGRLFGDCTGRRPGAISTTNQPPGQGCTFSPPMKKILSLVSLFALRTGAFAEEANAAKLALARDAIAAMQVDKMLDGMAGQVKQMAMQRAQLPASATPAQRQRFDMFMGRVTELAMVEVK